MSRQAEQWLALNGYGPIRERQPLSGGCIATVQRLRLDGGMTVVVKSLAGGFANMFAAESCGLQALAAEQAVRIPAVLHAAPGVIILEDLGNGRQSADYWKILGRQLAQLHGASKPRFGFELDNFCGATPQRNTPCDDGHDFFANHRLMHLGQQAANKNLLPPDQFQKLDYVASKLGNWIPVMPAVLIHGDLWSGNIHCDSNGQPALIDPAAYWGWAEAELAMTTLFGGFHRHFYDSYQEAAGINSEWQERAPLYNLYHLLNHLLLFGSSYL
ncbi:MAG: fructosamine kinase family protein, partial [Gammaproteobacteria bacterium]